MPATFAIRRQRPAVGGEGFLCHTTELEKPVSSEPSVLSHHSYLAALLAAAVILPAVAVTAETVEAPKRKPGLWEITTVAAGTGMTTIKSCIGPDDNIALPADSGECSQTKVTPAGAEVIVDVVCKRKYGKEIMSTAFGGDFSKRYHAVMKITYDPPEGIKNMGVTIDAKYLGPDCPAANKPAPAAQ